MEPQTANASAMPVLDEATFQQILEAAYVIQEQKQPQRGVRAKPDPAATLAEIAETQQLLRSQLYDLPAAAKLIAQRLQKITSATGVTIALIRGDQMEYCAATGTAASLTGSSTAMEPSLSKFLQEGDAQDRLSVNTQFSAELLQQGPGSPIFFPVYHDAKVAGLLQLSFPESAPIEEHEIQSCQVMAGLMGETIGRAAETEWKQALAAERATMLEALERLRPQLERLVAEPATEVKPEKPPLPEIPGEPTPDISELLAELALSPTTEAPIEPALDPATEAKLKKAVEPLAKLAPELAAEITSVATPPVPAAAAAQSEPAAVSQPAEQSAVSACVHCGHPFGEGELFCGRCGTPREMSIVPFQEQPVSAARPWPGQEEAERSKTVPLSEHPTAEPSSEHLSATELPADFQEALARVAKDVLPTLEASSTATAQEDISQTAVPPLASPVLNRAAREPEKEQPEMAATEVVESEPEHEATVMEPVEPELPRVAEPAQEKPQLEIVKAEEKPKPSPWGSAARARHWLEELEKTNSPARIWLRAHRADIWVGVSVVLLLLALSGWGTHSASYQAAKTPQPSLSLFERMLVGLGLAEAPPAPVYAGNPNVQVWVDTHTALYYCPGSELYGKTQGGKFTTQRDAQMDQFEPAARKNCE